MDPGKIVHEAAGAPEDFPKRLIKTVRWFCDNRRWWQNTDEHSDRRTDRSRLTKTPWYYGAANSDFVAVRLSG